MCLDVPLYYTMYCTYCYTSGQATGTSQHTVMRDSRAAARASGVTTSKGGLTPEY